MSSAGDQPKEPAENPAKCERCGSTDFDPTAWSTDVPAGVMLCKDCMERFSWQCDRCGLRYMKPANDGPEEPGETSQTGQLWAGQIDDLFVCAQCWVEHDLPEEEEVQECDLCGKHLERAGPVCERCAMVFCSASCERRHFAAEHASENAENAERLGPIVRRLLDLATEAETMQEQIGRFLEQRYGDLDSDRPGTAVKRALAREATFLPTLLVDLAGKLNWEIKGLEGVTDT